MKLFQQQLEEIIANYRKLDVEKVGPCHCTGEMKYDVVVANNGERALDLLLKRSFDFVFTALKMPGMDGLTLSLQVKATSLDTPVVLILDENIVNTINRIKAGRIDCVVSKPLSFGEIQKTVQDFVINRSRVQSSKI